MIEEVINYKTPVFFDNDGAIDDLVSLVLLLTYSHITLTGISITDGAGDKEHSIDSTFKILSYLGRENVPVALSHSKPIHSFPAKWRSNMAFIKSLPTLQPYPTKPLMLQSAAGSDFMAQTILSTSEKTTVLLTGPATNLVTALETYPDLLEKIDKVVWMAGAFISSGNVVDDDHDGSAEWNIYWDPISAQKLIKSGIRLIMFPLDACKLTPVDNYLMYNLRAKKKSELCQLIYKMFEPYHMEHKSFPIWDVVATAWLGDQSLAHLNGISADVETRGTSTGSIYRTANGAPIRYANWIDDELFYDFLIKQFMLF
jgi:purine nucleosidase